MATGRTLKMLGRRRRADDEDEDGDDPVMVEDSQSEGSAISDVDDEEADASSFSGSPTVEGAPDGERNRSEPTINGIAKTGTRKSRRTRKKGGKKGGKDLNSISASQTPTTDFQATPDTVAMMNGLKLVDAPPSGHIVDFEGADGNRVQVLSQSAPTTPAGQEHKQPDSPANKQRQEHEEPRKRREADPAFIPTRGNFFMHDTRSSGGNDAQSQRGAWSGRGRGRGQGSANVGAGASFSPAEQVAEQPWKHDLHSTVNEEAAIGNPGNLPHPHDQAQASRSKAPLVFPSQQRVVSFSSTTLVGKVQIRVCLPGMKTAANCSDVPWKHYTRLPDHRPPLRRDKPVRVSLPGRLAAYRFPAPERSFIFIPRQMRPNQQALGRSAYNRNSTAALGYSSRRTSVYGGSMYAASVAASRRSSFASVQRDTGFSPVGSFVGGMQQTRPVVRLPHGSQSHFPTQSASSMSMAPGYQAPPNMQMHTFPLPQQPTYQGIPTTTVHQPRPQKAISVTDLDSPAALRSHDSQPFQNQLPAHMNEPGPGYPQQPGPYYSPAQQLPYMQQPPPAGTPLSGIPEQAVHAPAFQPPLMPYGQYYMPPQPQGGYYYPPAPNAFQPMPMYMAPAPGYIMSPPAQHQPQQQPLPPPPPSNSHVGGPRPPPSTYIPASHSNDAKPPPPEPQQQSQPAPEGTTPSAPPQSHSGMVAHESNGMVFYLPASEAQQLPQSESYQPAESFVPSYAMPGLPPPTPAPDPAYYYPHHPPPSSNATVYYPTM